MAVDGIRRGDRACWLYGSERFWFLAGWCSWHSRPSKPAFPGCGGILVTRADSARDISAIEVTERAWDGGCDG